MASARLTVATLLPRARCFKQERVNYVAASTSKASDSFPGLIAIVTGGSPALTGICYNVAYARNLDAPAKTTGNGLAAGPCIQRPC
jgi:Type I phosphodiesterase / nucleotide pyrophosphatase